MLTQVFVPSNTQRAAIAGRSVRFEVFFQILIAIVNFLSFFFVFDTSPDDGDVVATRSTHKEGGSASSTDPFVRRETVPHWDLAEYRRLYPNTLDARRFGAVSDDGQNSVVSDRLEFCCDTDVCV